MAILIHYSKSLISVVGTLRIRLGGIPTTAQKHEEVSIYKNMKKDSPTFYFKFYKLIDKVNPMIGSRISVCSEDDRSYLTQITR